MKKSTRSAKADVFVVVLFLFIAASSINMFRLDLMQSIRLQNVEPAGTVIIKKNTVQRRLGNRVLWDRLTNESPVYAGDLIRVAEVSAATLDIGKNSIDMDENTIVRIIPSPDGEGFHIELSSGSLSLVSSAESSSITIDLNGRKVQTVPGAVLTATATDSGTALRVSAGVVQLVEEDGIREFSSVNILAMDPEGTEIVQRAAVVTSPAPNARFLKPASGALAVNFEWNRINLQPNELLRLEIAQDRSFRNITQTINNLDSFARASFNSGLWHWRLSFKDEVLSEGRLTVTEAGSQLLSPSQNSVFSYQDELPVMNFQWTETEDALSYVLEISDEPEFRNPRIQRQGSASFYTDSSLGRGIWYWRVMTVLPSIYESGSGSASSANMYSRTASFRIEQNSAQRDVENSNVSLADWLAAEMPSSMAISTPIAMTSSPPPVTDVRPAAAPTPASRTATTPTPTARPTPAASTVRLTLLEPADNHSINAVTALRQQTVFRWDCDTAVTRALFVLSQNQNPLRGRPVIEINNAERTIRVDRLSEGTWYWTVEVRTANGLTVSAPPRRLRVLPAPLLAAPQNLRPVTNYRFGVEQILSMEKVVFDWAAVPGANGYIFSLYRQTADGGRLQIVNADPQTQTSFTLEDMKILDRGNYIWQVEAVNMGSNGMIEQRGTPAENTFVFNFPHPSPVKIEDTGILYGN